MPKMQLSAQSCVSNIVLLLDIVICFLVYLYVNVSVLVTVCYILIIVAMFK